MSQKYPGGIISKTAPVTVGPVDGEGGSAPGVWTLTQALELNKQNLWPKPPVQGELYAWGYNQDGVLGLGDIVKRSSPVQVGALTNWSKITVNQGCFGIKSDGTLWAWGSGANGELGLGNTVKRSSPVQVGALTDWYEAGGGFSFCVATKKDNTLWSWGRNQYGQLGLGDTYNNRSSPVQVGALTNWKTPSGGEGFAVCIKTDGTLWAWGNNSSGQLGQGSYTNCSSPVQVGALTDWYKISTNEFNCIAIKNNGTLWAWGNNYSGQLGQNNTTFRLSPVQIGSATDWYSASIGGKGGVVAVKTNGTMWTWGRGASGRLGQNDTANRSSPTQVGILTNWLSASMAYDFCVAIKNDGTMWSWGNNGFGALGLNDTANRSSPVQIGALTTWSRLPKAQFSSSLFALKTP